MNTTRIKSSTDGIELSLAYIEPEGTSRGIVQIVHGMCEHKERYYPFMEFLAGNGFVCVIHDNRGHGESVAHAEDLGHFGKGGWKGLVDDIEDVRRWSEEMWPCHVRTLFGHSMGSMAVRSYAKRYDDRIDRLIVCGSPSSNPVAGAGKALAGIFKTFRGDHYRPQLLQDLSFGSYNKPFAGEGYASAWVCSDRDVLEAYHNDPLCQYVFTADGFANLMSLMKDCYSKKGWKVVNPDMPIYFMSGENDPCMGSAKQHQKSIDLMHEVGYFNVSSEVFPGMRHEILNETDRKKVWDHVLGILETRVEDAFWLD